MKAAIIAPTKMLPWTAGLTDYHLILPHLMQMSPYREFYRNAEGYKILDNGVAESVEWPTSALFEVAHWVGAHEIVVPDVMGDMRATFFKAQSFEKLAVKHSEFKYAAVVQGNGAAEWLTSFQNFAEMPWVDTIMFPRIMNIDFENGRVGFIRALFMNDGLKPEKEYHCLGASKWVREALALSEYPLRGMDTSLPVVMGLAGKNIWSDEYVVRQEGYFDMECAHDGLGQLVDHNCRTFINWCTGEDDRRRHPSQTP